MALVSCSGALFKLFDTEKIGKNYKLVHHQTSTLLDNLYAIHDNWIQDDVDVTSFKPKKYNYSSLTTRIYNISIPDKSLNIDRFISSNCLETNDAVTKFFYSLTIGDYDAVKIGMREKVPFNYNVAYMLAASLGHIPIVQLLIDSFAINPQCCDSFAILTAAKKEKFSMMKTLIAHNVGIISKKITEIDGHYDEQKWIRVLNICIQQIGYIEFSSIEAYELLFDELKTRLDYDNFFKSVITCLRDGQLSSKVIDFIFNTYDRIFCAEKTWRSVFSDMLEQNIRSSEYFNVEVIQYLLEMDYVSKVIDKHQLLHWIITMHRFENKGKIIPIVLQHKYFTWDVNGEIERDEKYARRNYDYLVSDEYAGEFLRSKNIDPVFNGHTFFRDSLLYLRVDSVKYCLHSKSQPINYYLATHDVYNEIYRNQREEEKDANGIEIIQLLLNDGRAKPYIHNNKFLQELIKDGCVELIEILIKSGQIFFPLCITQTKIYRYHADSVKFFAKNEDYFRQIVSSKQNFDDDPFIDKIIQVHDEK